MINITTVAAFHPIDWVLGLFGKLLAFFDSLTGVYILSIFIFAVIAKLILFPFGIKQQKNSIKQAKLRPKEQAIRKKYQGRTDRVTQQKMQQEIMDLYSSEGYSMFGGCLPMLIQLPFIIGLYEIIRNPLKYTIGLSDEIITKIRDTINFLGTGVLKGVDNLFSDGIFSGVNGLDYVTVLKNTDNFNAIAERVDMGIKYTDLPKFSFLGLDLSVTPMQVFSDWSLWYYLIIPILTFGSVYLSMKITKKLTYQPMQADQAAGCSGKMLDLTMPLLSTWFSFMFPAMLGIYWMFNNLLGIAQSFILKKMYPLPVFTEADYKAAEREMKGKAPKVGDEDNRIVPGKKYVSLHHIDDDDYDEKGNYIGPKEPEVPKENEQSAKAEQSSDAPILKDYNRDGKK